MEQKLLTIQEAADMLGVATKTLRRWEARGKLIPQRTTGNQRRYTLEQLQEFMAEQEDIQPESEIVNDSEEVQVFDSNHTSLHSASVFSLIKNLFPKPGYIPAYVGGLVLAFLTIASLVILFSSARILDGNGLAASLEHLSNTLRNNTTGLRGFIAYVFPQEKNNDGSNSVLAANKFDPKFIFTVNVPSTFKDLVNISSDLNVSKYATISGGLTAPNILYDINSGAGISISNGQTPTITNTGVLSLQGVTGAITLAEGDGLSLEGAVLTNTDKGSDQNIFSEFVFDDESIFADGNEDTLSFIAGTGIVLEVDADNKEVTITGVDPGWTAGDGVVFLTNEDDHVGIGTDDPSAFRLQVAGDVGPNEDNVFDLGSSDFQWRNVFLGGDLFVGGRVAGFLQRIDGVLAPEHISNDLAIGGTATDSAKFQIFGTTGAATMSGSLTFNTTGSIQTTNNQQLTIGGNTTGGITIANPITFDGDTIDDLTGDGLFVSGNALSVDLLTTDDGTGNTSSNSGLEFQGAMNEALTLLQGCTNNQLLKWDDTNNVWGCANDLGGSAATINVQEGGVTYTGIDTVHFNELEFNVSQSVSTATITLDPSLTQFRLANGANYAGNTTTDLLLGGNATTSAKFAFINVNNGTPTASISAGVSGAAYINASGLLQTTANQTLTLGGNTTGNITLSPLNGSGTVTSTGNMNIASGKAYQINGTDILNSTTLASSVLTSSLTSVGTITTGTWNAGIIGAAYGGTGTDTSSTTGIATVSSGTWSFLASLGETFGGTGQTSYTTGDMLYASNTNTLSKLAVGNNGQVLGVQGGLPTWIDTSSINYWQRGNGLVAPLNITDDLLLGGLATTSARFAVTNIAGGVPTASLSAGMNSGTYITASGNIATQAQQTLTLGGTTTGDVVLDAGTGTIRLADSTTITGNLTVTGTTGITSSGNDADLTFSGTNNHDISASSGTLRINAFTLLGAVIGNGQDITGLGQLTVDNLRLDGNTFDTTSGDLTLNAAGGDIIFTNAATLNIGGSGSDVAYNVIGDSTINASVNVDSDNDLYIEGNLEVDGTMYGNLSGNVSGGTVTPTGFTQGSVVFAGSGGTLAQDNASFFFDDTNNLFGIGTASPIGKLTLTGAVTGKALSIFNETGDQNILTASASGTTVANLDRSGNLSIEGALSDLGGTTLAVNDNLDVSGTLISGTADAFQVDASGNISTSGTTGLTFSSTGGINLAGGVLSDSSDGVDINDDLDVSGDLTISGGDIVSVATVNLVNTASTTVNFAGAATTLNIADAAISGTVDIGGVDADGASTINIATNSTSGDLIAIGNNNASTTLSLVGGDDWSITTAGVITGTQLNIDNIRLDGNTFSTTTGDITLDANGNNVILADGDTLNVGGAAAAGFNFFASTSTAGNSIADGDNDLYIEDELEVDGAIRFDSSSFIFGNAAFADCGALETVGNVLTCGSDDGGSAATNYWQLNNGALSPFSTTADVLIGGTATTSAKFAFINAVGPGTPTASISAGQNGGAYLTATGLLQTTADQQLTLGGNTTGSILLDDQTIIGSLANGLTISTAGVISDNNGNLSINDNTDLTGDLDISGTLTSGTTNAFQVDATGNIATSGTTGLTLSGSGTDITFSGGGTNILSSAGTLQINAFSLGGDITGNSQNITGVGQLTVDSLRLDGNTIDSTSGDITIDANGNNILFADGDTLNVGGAAAAGFNFFASSVGSNSIADGDNDLYIEDELEVDGAIRFDSSSITLGNGAFTNCTALETSGGVLTCGSDDTGGNTQYWQLNNGALSPFSSTADVLIGGTATTSAKFAFINVVGSGTPTASISAGVNGGAYLTATGLLQTTADQQLTLGGNSTGSILLDDLTIIGSLANGLTISAAGVVSDNNGNLSLNDNTDITGDLDISGTLTSGTANAFTVDASGNISTSGTTGLTFSSTGGVNFAGGTLSDSTDGVDINDDLDIAGNTTFGDAITDALTFTARVAQDSDLLPITTTGTNDLGSASLPWDNLYVGTVNQNGATLDATYAPINANFITVTANGTLTGETGIDALATAISTTSTLNVDSSTTLNTTTIDANANLTLSAGTGKLGVGLSAVSKFDVSGAVTGKSLISLNETGDQNILTASASGATVFNLTRSGTLQMLESAGATYYGTLQIGDLTADKTYNFPSFTGSTADVCLSTGNCVGGGGGGVAGSGTAGQIAFFDGAASITSETSGFAWDASNNRLGIGIDAPVSKFHLIGAVTGKALSIFNETGDQNIITASASGTTKFNVGNNGDITFAGNTAVLNTLTSGATSARTYTFPDSSGDVCLSSGNCAGGAGGSKWTDGGSITYLTSTTDDLAVGGSTLASSMFAIDESAGIFYFGSDNSANPTFTFEATDSDTADFGFNTNDSFFFSGANVGVGTTSPDSLLQASGAVTGKALFTLNETGDQNILTASASGTTVANLDRSGNLAIEGQLSDLSTATLTINDAASILGALTLTGVISDSDSNLILDDTVDIGSAANGLNVTTDGVLSDNNGNLALNDNTDITGDLGISSDLTVSGGDIISASTANLLNTGSTTINFAGAATTLNIADAAITGTIDIGGVTANGASTVNIATNNTSADTITIGNSNASTLVSLVGGDDWSISTAGVLTLDGSTLDIDSLDFTGVGALTTASGDLTLNPTDEVVFGDTDTIIIGGHAGNVAYNVISDSGGTPASGQINSDDDLFVEGTLEAAALYQGANQVCDSSGNCAGTTNYWQLNSGSIAPGNAANVADRLSLGGSSTTVFQLGVSGTQTGKALVSLNDTGTDQNILTASASGTTVANLNRSGDLAIEGQLSDLSTATLTINDALSVLGALTVTGVISDSDSNLILDDTVDLGSAANGINITTSGVISDNNGNISLNDNTDITGDLGVSSDLTVSGGDIVSASTANLLNTGSTTVNFAGAATTLNIADAAITGTIDIGGVTADGASTINIATNSTSADTLVFGNSNASTTFALTGGDDWSISAAGTLTLDGTTLDLDSLDFTGVGALTTASGDLTLNPTDEVVFGDTDTIIIGGHAGNVAYNVISDSGGTPASGQINSDDDLFVEGTLEAAALYQGANQVCDSSGNCAGTTNYWQLNSGSIAPGNAANVADRLSLGGSSTTVFQLGVSGTQTGKALVSLNDTGTDQNILTASASGTTIANLNRSGNLAIEGELSDLSTATLTINDALSVLGALTVTGVIADSDSNLILDDTVDLGSAANGINITTSGVISDNNGNLSLNDNTDITGTLDVSSTLTSGTANAFQVDASGNISTSGTTGLTFSSTGGIAFAGGTISDSSDEVDINDDVDISGDLTVTGGDIVSASTANLLNTTSTTINFAGAATTLNIADAAITGTIDIGGVTNNGATTVNIATNNTSADTITIGNSNASTLMSLVGGDDWSISTAGVLTLDGSTLDIDSLDFTGVGALTTGSGDLTLNPSDEVVFGDTDTIIIGGHAGNVAYNVISDSGGTPASGQIGSDDDLFVEGTIEAAALYQGANQVCDSSGNCASTTNYWQLNSGSVAPGNAANVADRLSLGGSTTTVFQLGVSGTQTGKALVSLNDTGTDQNILTASASGTTIANLDRSGNLAIEGQLSDLSTATLTINDALSVLGALTVTGVISDSDSNLILDDTVDLGSAANGINITTSGVISDNNGNLSLNDNTDITGTLDVSSTLTAGTADAFQVDASGNITTSGTTGLTFSSTGGINFAGGTLSDSSDGVDVNDDLDVSGDVTVSGGDIVSAATANLLNVTSTTINFAGAATTLNIADAAITGTIDIGGVTADGATTLNLATNSTSADTISIGNSNASTTLSLVGGDDWSLAATGVLTLSASASQTTAIVATDTDYTNFASIGDNDITGTTFDLIGTTATIDFTDFDVDSDGKVILGPDTTGDALAINYGAGSVDLQAIVVDGTTNDSTQTAGTIDLNIDSSTNNAVLGQYLTATAVADAGADTLYGNRTDVTIENDGSASDTFYANYIDLTQNDATSGTAYGLAVIANDAGSSAVTAGILIDNQQATDIDLTDGILLRATTDGSMPDAIDASDNEITNALNVGANTITGTTYTIETTSGDLTLNIAGDNLVLTNGDTLAIGGNSGGAYNAIAAALTNVDIADDDADLFIGDELEVNGAVRFDAAQGSISFPNYTTCSLETDGNGVIQCGTDDGGAGVQAYWQLNSGAITPFSITADVNLGATATSSAKISLAGSLTRGKALAIFNQTESQPIITASASGTTVMNLDTSGNLTIEGQLADLSQSTLTVNDTLSLVTGSTYQINGTDVLSANTLGSGVTASSLTSVGTITTGVWNSTAIGAGYGGTGVDSSSWTGVPYVNSGAWNFESALSAVRGGTGLSTFATGDLLYANSTTTLARRTVGSTGQILTVSGGVPVWSDAGVAGVSFWQRNNGAISQYNITDDLLLGATATASARMGFINIATGVPTIQSAVDLTIDPAGGQVTFADADTLIIGGHAGNVAYNVLSNSGGTPGSASIDADNDLYIQGSIEVDGNSQFDGTVTVSDLACTDCLDFAEFVDSMTVDAATDINLGANAFTIDLDSSGDFSIRDVTTDIATFADSGAITFAPTSNQNFTLNFTGTGLLDINPITYTNGTGGVDIARGTNFTGVNGETAIDLQVKPSLTLTEPASGQTFTWYGGNIDMSGISVTNTAGATSNLTSLRIAGVSDADASTVTGLDIANLSATAATERGINIGTGWDRDINLADTTPTIAIGDTGTLTINDGTNTLLTLADNSNTGDLGITGDLAVSGGDITTGSDLTLNPGDEVVLGDTDTIIIGGHAGNVAYNVLSNSGGTPGSGSIDADNDLYIQGSIEVDGASQFDGTVTVSDLACTDCLDFAEFLDSMTVDAATDINLGTNAFSIDLDNTGDFSIRDVTTDIATFADSGAITFAPTSNTNLTVNFAGTGLFDINPVTYTNGTGGVDIARGTNFTGVNGETAIDLQVKPSLTLTEPASGQTFTWYGGNIDMSGISVTNTAGATSNLTSLRIAGVSDADASTVTGLDIANLTGTAATERGITIGNGWDANLFYNDTTTQIQIADTGVFTWEDSSGNDLATLTDNSNAGDLAITGDLTVSGGDIVTSADLTLNPGDEVVFGDTDTLIIGGHAGNVAYNVLSNSGGTPGSASIDADNDLYIQGSIEVDGNSQFDGTVTVSDLACTDCLDFTEFIDSMSIDAATDINLGTNAFTIDLDNTGDFSIRDVTTDIAAFSDAGAITFTPTSGQNLVTTFAGAGLFDINLVTYTNGTGGVDIARGTNFTGVNGETAIDLQVKPSLTLTEPASGQTFTWYGGNIDMSGISVTNTAGATSNLTSLRIAGVSDADASTVTGLDIANITGTAASERGLTIGTGWDRDLNFADTTPTMTIGDTGTLTVSDGTNTLLTLADNSNAGDLTITGDITISGGDIVSVATANLLNVTSTTVNFAGAATTLNVADAAVTGTIDIGGVTADGATTLNVATNSTTADTITFGNSNASTLVTMTGGDDWSISSAGVLTLDGTVLDGNSLDFTTNGTITTGSGSNLTVTPGGAGDTLLSVDADSNIQVTAGGASGVDMIAISNTSQPLTANGIDGVQIDFATTGTTNSADNAAMRVNVTSNNNGTTTTLEGIYIGNLTSAEANSTETALRIGTGWDSGITVESGGITISGGSLTYSGSSRPTKTFTLSPEYSGGILTASSSATITGSMTSDASPSANFRTYYEWDSPSDTLQDYTVAVRVTLPADFSAWATSNAIVVNYNNEVNRNTDNKFDAYIYNPTDSASNPVYFSTANVGGTGKTWTTLTIDDSAIDDGSGSEWDAANETVTIYLKMYSRRNFYTQIGDITFSYLAAF